MPIRRLIRALLALALLLFPLHARAASGWPTWDTSRVVREGTTPVFTVDGRPFYVYGAAFFYERIPRDRWRHDLERYKALGINTIDLYAIWNWHEPQPGVLDFDGSTNPRRDLRGLLAMIHELGFKVILRPGPVIRNEWRNGGYPAWLLERPAYDMPLHDVLEGRYPATATLQNAHADAAAAEWLANRSHRIYAARWLHDVLTAVAPWSHDVLAIALDDDQGAYIDNDTWPAPHWHAYVRWLEATVRATVGPRVPLFINTYQTKVPSAAPVWAWGNWYQSDAYRIGDHDLAQIAFSFGMLQTQPNVPVMASEFQAGWLQGADESAPRAAAPENTTLALHEMLQQGVRGVVNFPVQDTLDPAGWEAPWANWFYAWDAAFNLQDDPAPRFAPTAAFGSLVRAYGPELAAMHIASDLGIAWLGDAYDPAQMTNARFAALAAATIVEQQRCRARALSCRIVDLHVPSELRGLRAVVLPPLDPALAFDARAERTLAAFRRSGGIVAAHVDNVRDVRSATGGLRDAALLLMPSGTRGMLDVFNPGERPRTTPRVLLTLGSRTYTVPTMTIAPGGARDIPLGLPPARIATPAPLARTAQSSGDVPIAAGAWLPSTDAFASVRGPATRVYRADVYRDGEPTFVLDNGLVRAVVAADAGARVLLFQRDDVQRNLIPTIGALRDDVAAPPSPSPRDYIAAYTHPIAAGTFNRAYACTPKSDRLICTYTAPDLAPTPVHFEKTFELDGGTLAVSLRADAPASSLSALDPTLSATLAPNSPGTLTIVQRAGFDLVHVVYPADRTARIRIELQGAPPGGTNRP